MKLFNFLLLLIALAHTAGAQGKADTTAVKGTVAAVNRALDSAVVTKNVAYMQRHFADDFYFKHGTGQIDNKNSWMQYVLDTGTHYLSRRHDSVMVELHGDVAIVAGTLTVWRPDTPKISGYALRYIRVYALRQKIWQLLSHRTVQEWHLPDREQ